MADLSDFKKDQIIGARMVGASVKKNAELFGVTRSSMSKIQEESENCPIGTVGL